MYFANIVYERMQINLSIALIQTFGRKFKCKLCEECFATFSRTNDKITAFLPLSIRNDDTFENTLFHEQGIFSSFFSLQCAQMRLLDFVQIPKWAGLSNVPKYQVSHISVQPGNEF